MFFPQNSQIFRAINPENGMFFLFLTTNTQTNASLETVYTLPIWFVGKAGLTIAQPFRVQGYFQGASAVVHRAGLSGFPPLF